MTKEKKQDTKQVATRMTARDIQPRSDESPRKKTVVHGMVSARHLNSN